MARRRRQLELLVAAVGAAAVRLRSRRRAPTCRAGAPSSARRSRGRAPALFRPAVRLLRRPPASFLAAGFFGRGDAFFRRGGGRAGSTTSAGAGGGGAPPARGVRRSGRLNGVVLRRRAALSWRASAGAGLHQGGGSRRPFWRRAVRRAGIRVLLPRCAAQYRFERCCGCELARGSLVVR